MNIRQKTRFLTQFSILLAIEAIFCFTPLGSLPIGPIVATLAMVPVIFTAVLLGARAGSLMGFFGGLFSFLVWTFTPPPTSAAFAFFFTPFYSVGGMQGNLGSLLICFVPRVLTGTAAALIFAALKKIPPKLDWIRYLAAGLFSSFVNTVGVLGGAWLFFGETYAQMLGSTMSAVLLSALGTNGLLEAAISAVSALVVCKPLKKALEKAGQGAGRG